MVAVAGGLPSEACCPQLEGSFSCSSCQTLFVGLQLRTTCATPSPCRGFVCSPLYREESYRGALNLLKAVWRGWFWSGSLSSSTLDLVSCPGAMLHLTCSCRGRCSGPCGCPCPCICPGVGFVPYALDTSLRAASNACCSAAMALNKASNGLAQRTLAHCHRPSAHTRGRPRTHLTCAHQQRTMTKPPSHKRTQHLWVPSYTFEDAHRHVC
jgi:hypothetical protein